MTVLYYRRAHGPRILFTGESRFLPCRGFKDTASYQFLFTGHRTRKHIPGVDMSQRFSGTGISAAVGMALSAKLQKKDYRVYTLLGDREIEEGQVWEAAMFAGHRKLDNLVVIVDNNGLQIDGPVDEFVPLSD